MLQSAFVSFTAIFPEDPDPQGSRCEGVGSFLSERLRELGVSGVKDDSWRDCGHMVDCIIDGKKIYFFVTYIGRPPVQYVLCCTSDRGIIKWLKGINDTKECWKLAGIIHSILKADSRFIDIRWYPNGWFSEGNEPWCPSPPEIA